MVVGWQPNCLVPNILNNTITCKVKKNLFWSFAVSQFLKSEYDLKIEQNNY